VSQGQSIKYRGHLIETQSYRLPGGRWRPKVLVSIYAGGPVHQKLLIAPLDDMCNTEEAADAYAIAMAKRWIDDDHVR
jgi:hypothetical protein